MDPLLSKIKKNCGWEGSFFRGDFSLEGREVLSPKIVIKLPWTHKKLLCKGEPYRSSGQRDLIRVTFMIRIMDFFLIYLSILLVIAS